MSDKATLVLLESKLVMPNTNNFKYIWFYLALFPTATTVQMQIIPSNNFQLIKCVLIKPPLFILKFSLMKSWVNIAGRHACPLYMFPNLPKCNFSFTQLGMITIYSVKL